MLPNGNTSPFHNQKPGSTQNRSQHKGICLCHAQESNLRSSAVCTQRLQRNPKEMQHTFHMNPHFFKALVTMKSTHTSLPLLCAGIITKQLWKLQSHTPFTQVKGHNFVSFWENKIDQTESYTSLPELPPCSLGILILCLQVSSHRRTEALCSWILFKVILQLYT